MGRDPDGQVRGIQTRWRQEGPIRRPGSCHQSVRENGFPPVAKADRPGLGSSSERSRQDFLRSQDGSSDVWTRRFYGPESAPVGVPRRCHRKVPPEPAPCTGGRALPDGTRSSVQFDPQQRRSFRSRKACSAAMFLGNPHRYRGPRGPKRRYRRPLGAADLGMIRSMVIPGISASGRHPASR